MTDENDSGNHALLPKTTITDEKERREIRYKYRELINDTNVDGEDEGRKAIFDLTGKLSEADELFDSAVHMTREAALDSRLMSLVSTKGAITARSLDTSVLSFIPSEFVEKLGSYVSPSDKIINWKEFGMKAAVFFKRSPSFHYMLGSFEESTIRQSQKPSQNRANKDDSPQQAEAPIKVTEVENRYEEATTEEVEVVLEILRHHCQENEGPICFFEFVMDPSSFTQTILNIFYVSFLVKDGYARVYLDSDSLPVIEPINDKSGGERSASKENRTEVVFNMNKQEWLNILEAFDIKRPLITRSRKGKSRRVK